MCENLSGILTIVIIGIFIWGFIWIVEYPKEYEKRGCWKGPKDSKPMQPEQEVNPRPKGKLK